MEMITRRIHIYASGREFLVVPAILRGEGMWAEMEPIQRVSIMPNRDTIAELAVAIDKAHRGPGGMTMRYSRNWDGEDGKWQRQNLLYVQLSWMPGMVTYTPQRRVPPNPHRDGVWFDAQVTTLPGDTTSRELAARLYGDLGQRFSF